MIINILRQSRWIILDLISPLRLWADYHIYQFRLPKMKSKIFSKKKIKVLFFPINIGMWKNDYLFQLLLKHPRFDPYIVSFFVPVDSWDFQLRNQKEMANFFKGKGYPYIDMYNVEKRTWFDVDEFNPDIVFYTQAVDVAYQQYKIKSLWKKCLFYYIPYSLQLVDQKKGYNTLLDNICDKFFAPSDYFKTYYTSFFLNKGKNIVVTGYPVFDYLLSSEVPSLSCWKGINKFRIIWAPHHSITNNDIINCSNFLLIADEMLKLARKYRDKVDFVFKPHPRLRPKLEQMDGWGVEKTEHYYNEWSFMPNTNYVDGDYFDLFRSSDAMIHDSNSFIVEYLVTGKPVMFMLKDGDKPKLNEYARMSFDHHYIGHTMKDIEFFINNVVIRGEDTMKEERTAFVHSMLLPKGDMTVAETIFNEIEKELK